MDGPDEGVSTATEDPSAMDGSDSAANTLGSSDWPVEIAALPFVLGFSGPLVMYHEKGCFGFVVVSKFFFSTLWSSKYMVRKLA